MQGLAKLLIRPVRDTYKESELGPVDFILCGKVYTRQDLSLQNPRGLQLRCSWFKPKFSSESLPCVVYCHGNCGSRKDALDIAKFLLPLQLTLFTFDFAGSGLSEGEYISLGYYESGDIKTVVEYVRPLASSLILWGRSMGACSVILYASCDPLIGMIVLDSPFTSLTEVMKEFVKGKFFVASIYSYLLDKIRKQVLSLARFDIFDVQSENYLKNCKMPAIIMHGMHDKLVPVQHSRNIFDAYAGDKYLLELGGGHNSGRPPHILQKVHSIIKDVLQSPHRFNDQALQTTRAQMPEFKIH